MNIEISATKVVKPWYRQLYIQVLIAIVAGILLGHFNPDLGASMKPFGDAFVKLLKVVIAPVIFLTVVHGIGSVGNDREKLVNVGGATFFYCIVLSTLALFVGLVVANVVQPGVGMNIDPAQLDSASVAGYAKKASESGVVAFFMHIIPSSFASAFVDGEVIQVLFLAIMTGLAITGLPTSVATRIIDASDDLLKLVFRIVNMLMVLAPIGAFGAMSFTIGAYGVASLIPLLKLVITFYLTSFFFIVVVIGALAWLHKIPFFKLMKYMKEEILLVLGTSSSEAALPSLMEKLKKAGCGETTVGLALPIQYSFNLCGINIYMTLAAIFLAQALNIELTLWQQLTILGIAIINSKGAAGVTGAGLIVLIGTLASSGMIPVASVALILGIDRFMSECRAITSFVGNIVVSVIIAKKTGELDEKIFAQTMDAQ